MELRPYQQGAVDWLAHHERGLVQAPAGSGKTVIGAAAVDRVLHKGSVCVIANTTDQLRQWATAFDRLDLRKRLKVDFGCGVGNFSAAGYDIVIVDEAHHGSAPSWLAKLKQAEHRLWGFSATPWTGDEDRDEVLRLCFRDKVHIVAREGLVEDGHITPAIVRLSDAGDPDIGERIEEEAHRLIEIRRRKYPFLWGDPKSREEQESRCRWTACAQLGIVDNGRRNNRIVDIAREEIANSSNVLILVSTIDHGTRLCARISGAEMVHSKLAKKKRIRLIDGFKHGSIPCLVATSLADEGLDTPIANVLILASAGRSPNKVIQRTGRVLRPFEYKTHGTIYDFKDTGHYMLKAQAQARVRVYRKLGYNL